MSQQSTLEVDTHSSARLLSHLSGCIHALESMPPSILQMAVSPMAGSNPMPSPVSPPIPHETCLPQSYESLAKSVIHTSSHTSPQATSLSSLTSITKPSEPSSLSKSSNITTSTASDYANSLARVAASAHQYSALLQGAKISPSIGSFPNITDPRVLSLPRTQASDHLSSLYRGPPTDAKLDEYRRSLTKSSSVLCGIDDKAWRPW